jgi:hypothetical protein
MTGEQPPPHEELQKISRSRFYSTRVDAGDYLLLQCTVPHYGVDNPDAGDRYVVFLLYSPRSSPVPDTEVQRYPHGVVA